MVAKLRTPSMGGKLKLTKTPAMAKTKIKPVTGPGVAGKPRIKTTTGGVIRTPGVKKVKVPKVRKPRKPKPPAPWAGI